MPVTGPVSGRIARAAHDNLEKTITAQVEKGAQKILGDTLAGIVVDKGEIQGVVHDVLTELWGDVGPAQTPANTALKDAARSFVEPELSAAERREKLKRAAGDPLTDAVLGTLVDIAALVPAGALQKGTALLGARMGEGDVQAAVSDKWYATFLPSGSAVTELGPALEAFRARLQEPGFRDQISRALEVVRVLGKLEAHNLEKIAVDVDAAKQPEVQRAFTRFSATAADAIVRAILPADVKEHQLARDLLALTSLAGRAATGDTTADDRAAFDAILARLSGGDAFDAAPPAEALAETGANAHALPALLDAAQARLVDDLQQAGVVTAEAREGIKELTADLSAVAVTSAHLFRLVGAMRNDKIPERERIDLIKVAAKDAGPIVVKLLQTWANAAATDGGPIDGVSHRALLELQERVPPMTDAEVRGQIEAGLGKKLEEAFVSFDMSPMASASIGQVHHAQIAGRFGKVQDVVVKVQRPHLDEDFARATRVARLGLELATGLIGSGLMPKEVMNAKELGGADPVEVMRLIQTTIQSFVDSFHVETDFDKERVNLKKFRRDMKSHSYVTAPYVYRQWSSKTVMTMQAMRLEKIGGLLDRAKIAKETRTTQAPLGRVDESGSAAAVADIKRRTVDHVARAFGMRVSEDDVQVAQEKGRYMASVKTGHGLYPLIKLGFENPPVKNKDPGADPPGVVIKHLLVPPVVNNDDVRATRDRFLASVLSQVFVHGRVHGDPHKGNWGLMADGKTIVMLDFGKMIDLSKKHLSAPLMVAWNWFRRDPASMADNILAMSTSSSSSKAERKEARAALVEALTALQKSDGTRMDAGAIIATATTTLAKHGLGLSDVYTQGIKTAFSFAGNISGLGEVGAGDLGLGSFARAGRIAAGDAVDTVTFGVVGSVLALRKNARVASLNKAPKTS